MIKTTIIRQLTFNVLLLAGFFAGLKVSAQTRADSLAGAWVPLTQAMGGKALPTAAFAKEKLIISDSSYTVIAESVDKGVVKYNGNRMDIYGRQGVNAGKHFTAVYKFENGQLTICYNLKGDSYPETFDTTGKPLFFVSTFKKEDN